MNEQPPQSSAPPRISFVVPVYNGQATLRECLTALCNQTVPLEQYEVLVIDDGSTDETPRIIAEFPVRCVRLEQNAGRLVARATGAREAASDMLFFCDSRIILEPDALEIALNHPQRPLMYGSDFPESFFTTLYGRFLFCVYRKLWKPHFPQEWYARDVALTEENFEKLQKGMGVFVTERDFFLRHQPQVMDRTVSDDTLVLAGMVKERPVIRTTAIKAHYRQRTQLRHILPHLHFRGVLFDSYYIHPRHRFFWYYVATLMVLLTAVGVSIARPALAWVLPAALAAGWLGFSAALAEGWKNFLAVLAMVPIVCTCFWTGILRGHGVRLRRWLRANPRQGVRSAASLGVLVAILLGAGWYIHGNWEQFRQVPVLPWWGWPVLGAFVVTLHLGAGLMTDTVVRPHGLRLRADEWLGLSFLTALGNLLGPMRLGVVMRSIYLKRRGLPYSLFVSAMGGMLILVMLSYMVAAAVGLGLLYGAGHPVPLPLVGLVGGLLASLGLLATWAPPVPARIERALPLVGTVVNGWRKIVHDRPTLWRALAVGLVYVAVYVLMFWTIYRLIRLDVPLGAMAVMCGLGAMVSWLAITPGAIGFFDVTAVVTGTWLGVPPEASVMAMLIYRAIDLAMTLSLGSVAAAYMLRRGAGPAEAA